MQKKAAIEISTMTLIGLVIAIAIFIGFVWPVIKTALNIIIPKADITTLQNYERLVNEINELKEGEMTFVPYYVGGNEYKLVTMNQDRDCYPTNCLCLCNINGCALRTFEKDCFRGLSVSLVTFPKGIGKDRVVNFKIEKIGKEIKMNDLDYNKESMICCKIVDKEGKIEYKKKDLQACVDEDEKIERIVWGWKCNE